jgi:cation transport ATPase
MNRVAIFSYKKEGTLKKRMLEYTIVFIIFVILFNLYASNRMQSTVASKNIDIDAIIQLHLIASLYMVIMGLIIEKNSLIRIVKKRKLTIKPLFIVSAILFLISVMFLPLVMKFGLSNIYFPFPQGGLGINVLIAPFIYVPSVQNILTLIATIGVVRRLADIDN